MYPDSRVLCQNSISKQGGIPLSTSILWMEECICLFSFSPPARDPSMVILCYKRHPPCPHNFGLIRQIFHCYHSVFHQALSVVGSIQQSLHYVFLKKIIYKKKSLSFIKSGHKMCQSGDTNILTRFQSYCMFYEFLDFFLPCNAASILQPKKNVSDVKMAPAGYHNSQNT